MDIAISLILLFSGIVILILIHACIVGRTIGRALNNNNNVAERGSLGSTSMSRDDIEKLPSFHFEEKAKTKSCSSSPAAGCAVCLENFKMGEKCRLLPSCNHSFHADCVDLWLLRAAVCPICRAAADEVLGIDDFGEIHQIGDEIELDGDVTRSVGEIRVQIGNEGGDEIKEGQIGDFGGGEIHDLRNGGDEISRSPKSAPIISPRINN